jgi:hypothetical protein
VILVFDPAASWIGGRVTIPAFLFGKFSTNTGNLTKVVVDSSRFPI